MVHQDTHGVHHYHKRKHTAKKAKKKDKYWKIWIDYAIYFFVFAGPLMTLPQVIKIWVEQDATGVSLLSWSSYLVAATFWLIYGIAHKEKPLIFSYIIWIVMEIAIVAGVVMYA